MTIDKPEGYLAVPKTGNGAGVLVLHAWWGLNPFFQGFCRRLARAGFVAFAPDLYHGQVAATIPQARQLSDNLTREQVGKEMDAAIAYLHSLGSVTGSCLGVVGFSLGANIALGLSIRRSADIGAVVCFYGTRPGDYAPAQAAYLGHFAEQDEWEPAEGVQQLEQSLRAAHRPVKFHTYPGTGHWFFEKDRLEAYHAPAARVAWRRSLAFLRATLTPPAKP